MGSAGAFVAESSTVGAPGAGAGAGTGAGGGCCGGSVNGLANVSAPDVFGLAIGGFGAAAGGIGFASAGFASAGFASAGFAEGVDCPRDWSIMAMLSRRCAASRSFPAALASRAIAS